VAYIAVKCSRQSNAAAWRVWCAADCWWHTVGGTCWGYHFHTACYFSPVFGDYFHSTTSIHLSSFPGNNSLISYINARYCSVWRFSCSLSPEVASWYLRSSCVSVVHPEITAVLLNNWNKFCTCTGVFFPWHGLQLETELNVWKAESCSNKSCKYELKWGSKLAYLFLSVMSERKAC
jgi:hypothetical protein